ncbi:auxin-responsive IAA33 [Olea europaea subsp. europaea]|uniref:Auxin-responsive protein n=1 Tax=Olea europaea subsp. europaea TaxID=158383 RepID=A0A8S0TP77_OLEEU|nr:auxin-responsive IAA33 [Olea europaea subsp. europaea]
MSNFDSQRQESLKRRWQEQSINHSTPSNFYNKLNNTAPSTVPFMGNPKNLQTFSGFLDDDLVSSVVPPVTVVLEGRSICPRISLHKHGSYESLAKALRQMFVDEDASSSSDNDVGLDLSNAVPGHLIAYEDMENDLLLVGDLNWKDFVRVAKRIRILPAKGRSRTQKQEMN